MKHLYIGSAILLVLLACSIFSAWYISHSTQICIKQLHIAMDFLETDDFSIAKEYGLRAAQVWERRASSLSAFLSHNELEEVSNTFTALRSSAATQVRAEFRRCCDEMLLLLDHLSQSEIPKYYNFLSICIGT